MELRGAGPRTIRWNLRNRASSRWTKLSGVCRAAGQYGVSVAVQPGHRITVPQPDDGRGLATAAGVRSARGEHQLYDANPSRKLSRFHSRRSAAPRLRTVRKHNSKKTTGPGGPGPVEGAAFVLRSTALAVGAA